MNFPESENLTLGTGTTYYFQCFLYFIVSVFICTAFLSVKFASMAEVPPIRPSHLRKLVWFSVSAELGDYHPDEHKPGYLSGLSLVPNQSEEMELKIEELHKLHK